MASAPSMSWSLLQACGYLVNIPCEWITLASGASTHRCQCSSLTGARVTRGATGTRRRRPRGARTRARGRCCGDGREDTLRPCTAPRYQSIAITRLPPPHPAPYPSPHPPAHLPHIQPQTHVPTPTPIPLTGAPPAAAPHTSARCGQCRCRSPCPASSPRPAPGPHGTPSASQGRGWGAPGRGCQSIAPGEQGCREVISTDSSCLLHLLRRLSTSSSPPTLHTPHDTPAPPLSPLIPHSTPQHAPAAPPATAPSRSSPPRPSQRAPPPQGTPPGAASQPHRTPCRPQSLPSPMPHEGA